MNTLTKTIATTLLCLSSFVPMSLVAESAFYQAAAGSFGGQIFNWEQTNLWRLPALNSNPQVGVTPPITDQIPANSPGMGAAAAAGGQVAYFVQVRNSSLPLFLDAGQSVILGQIYTDFSRRVRGGQILASTALPLPLYLAFNADCPDPSASCTRGITFRGNPNSTIGNHAFIILRRGFLNLNGNSINLDSPLTVRATTNTANASLTFNSNLFGNQNLIIDSIEQVPVSLTQPNADFRGQVIVEKGLLILDSGGGPSIRNLTINGGIVRVGNSRGNQFYPDAIINHIDSGTLDLNNSNLVLPGITIFNQGQIIRGANVTFSENLEIKGATIQASRLIFNSSSIIMNLNLPGSVEAIIGANNSRMRIDPPSGGLIVDLPPIPPPQFEPFELSFRNIDMGGDGIRKIGGGNLAFDGGRNEISKIDFQAGGLIFGSSGPTLTNIGNETLTVPQNTLIRGHGTLGFNLSNGTLVNNGVVAPGGGMSEFGNLTINGNFIQNDSGVLVMRINNSGRVTQLNVQSGTVQLAGNLILVGQIPHRSGRRTLLENRRGAGSIRGHVGFINQAVLGPMVVTLEPETLAQGTVTLAFEPGPSTEEGDAIEYQTADVLFGNSGALTQIHGLNLTSSSGNLVSHASGLLTALDDDLIATHAHQRRQIDIGRFWAKPDNKPATVYLMPMGNWGKIKPSPTQEGVKIHSVGGALGGDYAFERVGVGGFLGYKWTKGTEDEAFGNFRVNSLLGRGYSSILPLSNRNFFLDVIGGGTRNWYTFNRDTGGAMAVGKPKGWEYDLYAGLGYNFNFRKQWRLTPLAGAQYINTEINSFEETGSSHRLHVDELKKHFWFSWLGLLFGGRLEYDKVIWIPEVRGYWQHQFSSLYHCLAYSMPCFGLRNRVQVQMGDRNYGTVGGDLQLLFGPDYRWIAGISYDYLWSRHVRDNNMYGKLGINF